MSNDFWGNTAADATGEFDSGGGKFELIPEGEQILAAITEAEWTVWEGDEYITLTWVPLKPERYQGRKAFQKIKVLDSEAKKADKAKRMLAAIDKNASGGKLLATGAKPTNTELARCLIGKPMVLKIGVWELNDKSGNWVMAVAPKTTAPLPDRAVLPAQPKPKATPADYEDDLPF